MTGAISPRSSANATATLTLWHDGKSRKASVTLTLPPEDPPRDLTELTGRQPLAGAVVANLNPALDDELNLDPTSRGVVVSKVKSGSTAEELGLQPGDIVASVNRRTIDSVDQLQDVVASAPPPWTVTIRRNGQLISVTVR